MGQIIDISGKKFGRLTVIKIDRIKNHRVFWLCKCDCGNTTITMGDSVKRGLTKSCGCIRKEVNDVRLRTHGKSHTPEYKIWTEMNRRCYNKNRKRYKDYGGRGIYVSDSWRNSFENFFRDMRERPFKDASIDRIDNNGPYSPENCKWSTRVEQANNMRSNHPITFDGKTRNLNQWAKEFNIDRGALQARLKLGWSDIDALTKPIGNYKHKHP